MAVSEEAVLSFVRSRIRSAWALELLVLLRRDPEEAWTIEALVRELRGSFALVTESLNALSGIGLVAAGAEGCRYRPQSRDLDDMAAALAALYAQKPITVLKAIFTSPPSDKIQSLSDAFLIRRRDRT